MKTRKEIIKRVDDLKKDKKGIGNHTKSKSRRRANILDWSVGKYESEIMDRINYLKECKKDITTNQGKHVYNSEISELLWVLDY